MELKDFIVKTISDIFGAVEKLQQDGGGECLAGCVSPSDFYINGRTCVIEHLTRKVTTIHFDLQLEAETEATASGTCGAGIKVVAASLTENGRETEKTVQNVKFDLDVVLPSIRVKRDE